MIRPRTAQTPAAVARHYDELDPFYREVWGGHVHHGLWTRGDESVEEATEALALRVAAEAHVQSGTAVVDIGCGYGGTARLLAERFGARVVGFTLSAEQAAFAARQSAPPGTQPPDIRVQDWLKNELPDATFDAAIAIESLSHMDDKARALAEAYRVLKPGGRFVACVWLAGAHATPWQVGHLLEPICREGRLPGLATEAEYRAWLAAAGFRVERFEDLSRRVRRTWTVIARRVGGRLVQDGRYRRFLLDRRRSERVFARTLLRFVAAYRTGAMRYGLVVAEKPASNPSA